jgi:hypothetical protein
MTRKLTASVLSLLLFFAATISLSDGVEPGGLFANLAPEQTEPSFAGSDDFELPDYPEAISQRLLRQRLSPRALIGERSVNLPALSSFCKFVHPLPSRRTALQDLYQHQTSLRI